MWNLRKNRKVCGNRIFRETESIWIYREIKRRQLWHFRNMNS